MARFRIVFMLAWRNLFSHKGKNLLVGFLIAFGAFLVVVGTSLLDSIEHTMNKSIISSVAGHLQVYDKKAKDELALFGGGFMGSPDIGSMPDYAKIKKAMLAVPNVKAVVPMGIDIVEFYTATELDYAIESFRKVLEKDAPDLLAAVITKIRAMAELLKKEFENRLEVLANREEVEKGLTNIERVLSDDFWVDVKTRSDQVVEFLDTKLAPLVDEAEGLFMRYLGTDLHLFAQHFESFEIVNGQMVPQGSRGLLLNQKFYDDIVRNQVARELDDLHEETTLKGKKIRKDPLLQNQVERIARQYRRITFQLEPDQAQLLSARLQKLMPQEKGNIEELVQAFLLVNDDNLNERHKFFFEEIAPLIKLYKFNIGDVITIRAYTRSGYIKSSNVKVYGTFRFKGLESSDLAGAFNLLDMLTFRDLYGMMTAEKLEELKGIKEEVGLTDIGATDAEAALFGADSQVEARLDQGAGFDEFAGVDLKKKTENGMAIHESTYEQKDIDHGVALNAAIILDDPKKLEETRVAIEQTIAANQLEIQVIDWQAASGIVGQLVVLVRVVLYVAIFIIFLVALVVINNTMIMATMERTVEIGTMRAIGGQSRFILGLFMLETILLGMAAGLLGSIVGAIVMLIFGHVGIPAVADILVFLFSGPRLFPTVGLGNMIGAWVVILFVSLVATFYPAFIATRIQPFVAMQARE
ncbi:MAG: FtsX-like permease family protein [Deltaproteobacteria bacterium]|nr:FtsX-like permease family protein [Deltaproteobacteria bacterium]MBW1871884.1 FtsX-like permease family protein [Deltaproteobacteria bacterium]